MKTNLVVGIDVSKSDLDFAEMTDILKREGKITNKVSSIKDHLSQYDPSSVRIVFEPTGTYSDKLQQTLTEMGFVYHRVNPRKSHHFAMSNGVLNKTDRQAAIMLAMMGRVLNLPVHQPDSELITKRKQIIKAIVGLETDQRSYKNKIHALEQLVKPNVILIGVYKEVIDFFEDKIKQLQKELVDVKDVEFEAKKKLAMSICGIGPVISTWLLSLTNNLESFENGKEVKKFLGLAPGSHRSGTSVNKKNGINKGCAGKIRGYLYMGAKSAIRFNPACHNLYNRLRAKGKNYYQAMVAVMGKLIEQFFAVVKSGVKYSKEYHLKYQKI